MAISQRHPHLRKYASASNSAGTFSLVKCVRGGVGRDHPAQQDAWFALLFTHAAVTARIDAVLMDRHRISFSAFEILCRLKEREPQAIRSLASQLVSVSPTRASRLMQDLVDAGYLRRGADQGTAGSR